MNADRVCRACWEREVSGRLGQPKDPEDQATVRPEDLSEDFLNEDKNV